VDISLSLASGSPVWGGMRHTLFSEEKGKKLNVHTLFPSKARANSRVDPLAAACRCTKILGMMSGNF